MRGWKIFKMEMVICDEDLGVFFFWDGLYFIHLYLLAWIDIVYGIVC